MNSFNVKKKSLLYWKGDNQKRLDKYISNLNIMQHHNFHQKIIKKIASRMMLKSKIPKIQILLIILNLMKIKIIYNEKMKKNNYYNIINNSMLLLNL